jgi:hypothetical protein
MELISEVEGWKVIERELRTGFQLQKQTEIAREKQAEAQAKENAGKVVKAGGLELRKIASVPMLDFIQITKKYGHEAFGDDEFLADLKKRKRHLTTDFCPDRKRMRSVLRSA